MTLGDINKSERVQDSLPEEVKSSGRGETEALHALVPQPKMPKDPESKRQSFSEEERKVFVEKGKKLIDEHCDKDVLKSDHHGHIDDRLFAHIHGDSYVNGTALEGNVPSRTLHHMFYYLEKFKPFERWNDILEAFRKAPDYAKRLEAIILDNSNPFSTAIRQEKLNQLSDSIVEDIFNLGSGQKLLIPGGFKGHAMLYQVTKEANGTFTLEVLNTGSGLNHHKPHGIKGKIKFYPFKRFEKIALDKKLWRDFMQAALECQAPLNSTDTPYDSVYVYQKILPMLKGIEVPVVASEQDVITVQRGGTCTERVLHAYIRRHCMQSYGIIEPYKNFKIRFKRQTLIHYFQINKAANRLDRDTVIINLEKSLAKLSRSIDKRINAGKVYDQELEEDIAILEAIQAELNFINKKLVEAPKDVPEVKFPTVAKVPSLFAPVSVQSVQNKLPDQELTEKMEPPPLRPNLEHIGYHALGTYAEYAEALLKSGKREDQIEVLQFFIEALSKMPYESISYQGQPALWISQLDRFTEAAFLASSKLRDKAYYPITQPFMLYQIKALLLIEHMAHEMPNNKLDGYKLSNHLNELRKYCLQFILTDPVHARNFDEMVKRGEIYGKNAEDLDLGFASESITEKNLASEWERTIKFYAKFEKFDPAKHRLLRIAEACADMGEMNIMPKELISLKNSNCASRPL